MKREVSDKIKKDFEFIKGDVEGILLFGSIAKGESHKASDIDVCLVNPRDKNVLIKVFERLGGKYDVKVFEDLPLYIQIDIIKNHEVIFGDEIELSYHFYKTRKIWNDMEERIKRNQFKSVKEMVRTRRRWLDEKRNEKHHSTQVR
ncbi:MAG: nucleotidyltransferase domain-containing protein [Euryarchaeota archaeon]|nr:nucleotidyltransferase domain-containing protein [Euryarchaeota archaeon]